MTFYYDELSLRETGRPGGLATAALLSCGLCGHTISGMGGPGQTPICEPCHDLLYRGHLRGCVIWDEGEHAKAQADIDEARRLAGE